MVLAAGVAAPAAVQFLLRTSMIVRYRAQRCICTGDALDIVPLLLGYMSFELATLAGFEPAVLR